MGNKIFLISCTDDYPFAALANNTKIGLLAKGLAHVGDQVVIVNKYYGNNEVVQKQTGHRDGCVYLTLPQGRSKTLSSLQNLVRICRILYLKRLKICRNQVILSDGSFFHHCVLCVFCGWLNIRRVLIFQEWHLAFSFGYLRTFNNYLFDRCLPRFVDALLPISEFIAEQCNSFGKPCMKIPIAADFKMSLQVKEQGSKETYFLYCASAGYLRIICFILESFRLFKQTSDDCVKLKLVLSGSLQLVQEEIRKLNLEPDVEIYFKVPYEQLLRMYAGANGLLIPLDPESLQDVARFSQKIAEYLSSCRPILTTNVGEIPYYFQHGKNAFVASSFDTGSYAALMSSVINDPVQADRIGNEGYFLGKEEFDYQILSRRLHDFLATLEIPVR